jgi:hypothetical protein
MAAVVEVVVIAVVESFCERSKCGRVGEELAG